MSGYATTAPADAGDLPATPDTLVIATASSMRARRHPWAIAGMWAWETSLALVASLPAASLVRAAYGGDPHGDAPLWEPGGHALLDFLWHEMHGVTAVVLAGAFALAVGLFAGLVPLAMLMTAMAYETTDGRRPGVARCAAAGLRAFRPFAVLLVAFGVAEGLVVGAGAGAARLAEGLAHASLGEARAELLEGVLMLPFLVGASLVGVAHDLARAAVVRAQVSGLRGLMLGVRVLRAAPVRLAWAWAWRAGAAAAPVLAVAAAGTQLGPRGGFALALVALAHQAIVVARVALRASWLGRALQAYRAPSER